MIIETKHTASQGPAYLVLGPEIMQFIGRKNFSVSEPACIAYDSLTCKPVSIGSQAEDVAKRIHCGVYWPLIQECAFPDLVEDLTNGFVRRVVSSLDYTVAELIVILPKQVFTDEVMRAVQSIVRKVFGCKSCRFAELKKPEEGLVKGFVYHDAPGPDLGRAASVIVTAELTCMAAVCSMIVGLNTLDTIFSVVLTLAASAIVCQKATEAVTLRKEKVVAPSDVQVSRVLIMVLCSSVILTACMWALGKMALVKIFMVTVAGCMACIQSDALESVRGQVRREHIVRVQWAQNKNKSRKQ